MGFMQPDFDKGVTCLIRIEPENVTKWLQAAKERLEHNGGKEEGTWNVNLSLLEGKDGQQQNQKYIRISCDDVKGDMLYNLAATSAAVGDVESTVQILKAGGISAERSLVRARGKWWKVEDSEWREWEVRVATVEGKQGTQTVLVGMTLTHTQLRKEGPAEVFQGMLRRLLGPQEAKVVFASHEIAGPSNSAMVSSPLFNRLVYTYQFVHLLQQDIKREMMSRAIK